MNKFFLRSMMLLLCIVPALSLSAQGSHSTQVRQSTTATGNPADIDGDGLPLNAEQLLGTNPYLADTDGDTIPDSKDDYPLDFGSIPEDSSTIILPITVVDARVEDNYKADDHLEFTLKNDGSDAVHLSGCYITIKDKKSGSQEIYYVNMGGFTLTSGSKKTIHFDNGKAEGHFPGNINGLYRTAADGLLFQVSLRSSGFKPLAIQVEKDPGTAEIAD